MCSCHHKIRIAVAQRVLELADDELIEIFTAHDETCSRVGGECCDCAPRIIIRTAGGEICIDEDGVIATERMN